jgi:hypothetical protein
MAATASPYGLRPVNRTDGMPYAGATSQFLIDPAGEATNLFYGQVVIIGADGYIALSTATGADLTTNNLGGSSLGAIGVCLLVAPTLTRRVSKFTPSTTPLAQLVW